MKRQVTGRPFSHTSDYNESNHGLLTLAKSISLRLSFGYFVRRDPTFINQFIPSSPYQLKMKCDSLANVKLLFLVYW